MRPRAWALCLQLLVAIQVLPESVAWKDGPSSLPPGAKSAVLEGDPKKKGLFTMRLKLPPHYQVPVHWHPQDERVTVVEGAVTVSFQDGIDGPPPKRFPAGSYYVNPARKPHFVWTEGEGAVLQMTGLGPWGIEFPKPRETARTRR